MLKVSMVLTVDFESVLISSKLIWKIPIQEWFKSNEMHHFRFRNGSNQMGGTNFDSEMAQIKWDASFPIRKRLKTNGRHQFRFRNGSFFFC